MTHLPSPLPQVIGVDQILVLHEGRVAERGRHTELIGKKGHYYDMWQAQLEAASDAEAGANAP